MQERRIGTVEHYYPRRKAAAVRLEDGPLQVGDHIRIVGRGVDMLERVLSMEIDHEPVNEARDGQVVGVEVSIPLKPGATVFRAEPEYSGETY